MKTAILLTLCVLAVCDIFTQNKIYFRTCCLRDEISQKTLANKMQCAGTCTQVDECKGFTYTNGNGSCTLYSYMFGIQTGLHFYNHESITKNYEDGRSYCNDRGQTLLNIQNELDQDNLEKNLVLVAPPHTGMIYDNGQNKVLDADSGLVINWSKWYDGFPDETGPHISINTQGFWHSVATSVIKPVYCQKRVQCPAYHYCTFQ